MVAKIVNKGRGRFEWFIISKKTIYRVIYTAITLLILGGGAYAIHKWIESNPKLGPSGPSARFLKIEGRVTVKHNTTNETIPANNDTKLQPGDTIQTGTDASAVVEYADGSRYNIKSGSTVIFKEESTYNNQTTRVEHEVRVGKINVRTLEKNVIHQVSLPNTKAVLTTNSDADFGTNGDEDAIVVNGGRAKVTTSKGAVEEVAANERLDVNKSGTRRTLLPPPPDVTAPQNAAQFLLPKDTAEVEFAWQPVPNADNYRLMISPAITFPQQALTIDRPGITKTKYKWQRPGEGNYYWRVQAITKEGVEGNWSDAPNFSVKIKGYQGIPIRVTKTVDITFLLVEVEGVTKPGVNLRINDKTIPVDSKGIFKADVSFPASTRQRTLIIEAVDVNGNSGREVKNL